MVSTCPLISKSTSFFTNPLWIIPSDPITTDITVTFMFNIFFKLLVLDTITWSYIIHVPFIFLDFSINVYIFIFLSAFFESEQSGQQSLQFDRFTYFFSFYWLSLCIVVWSRIDDLFLSQNPREVWMSFSPGRIQSCAQTACS